MRGALRSIADESEHAHQLAAAGRTATADSVIDKAISPPIDDIERIVATLEKGQAPLEESIRLYERGEAIKKHCDAQLKSAEARIEKITLDPAGKPVGVAPLDVE